MPTYPIKNPWMKLLAAIVLFGVFGYLCFYVYGVNTLAPFLAAHYGESAQAEVISHHIETSLGGQEIDGKFHQHYMLNVEFKNRDRLQDSDIEVYSGAIYHSISDGTMVGIHYFSFFPFRPALDLEKNSCAIRVIFLVFFMFSFVGFWSWWGRRLKQTKGNSKTKKLMKTSFFEKFQIKDKNNITAAQVFALIFKIFIFIVLIELIFWISQKMTAAFQ